MNTSFIVSIIAIALALGVVCLSIRDYIQNRILEKDLTDIDRFLEVLNSLSEKPGRLYSFFLPERFKILALKKRLYATVFETEVLKKAENVYSLLGPKMQWIDADYFEKFPAAKARFLDLLKTAIENCGSYDKLEQLNQLVLSNPASSALDDSFRIQFAAEAHRLTKMDLSDSPESNRKALHRCVSVFAWKDGDWQKANELLLEALTMMRRDLLRSDSKEYMELLYKPSFEEALKYFKQAPAGSVVTEATVSTFVAFKKIYETKRTVSVAAA